MTNPDIVLRSFIKPSVLHRSLEIHLDVCLKREGKCDEVDYRAMADGQLEEKRRKGQEEEFPMPSE